MIVGNSSSERNCGNKPLGSTGVLLSLELDGSG